MSILFIPHHGHYMNSKKSYLAIFGIILAVGLMASAFILGNQLKIYAKPVLFQLKDWQKVITPQHKGHGLSA